MKTAGILLAAMIAHAAVVVGQVSDQADDPNQPFVKYAFNEDAPQGVRDFFEREASAKPEKEAAFRQQIAAAERRVEWARNMYVGRQWFRDAFGKSRWRPDPSDVQRRESLVNKYLETANELKKLLNRSMQQSWDFSKAKLRFFEEGMFGSLTASVRVQSVVDRENLVAQVLQTTVWIEGVPLKDVVEGAMLPIDAFFIVDGMRTYETEGVQRDIPRLQAVDIMKMVHEVKKDEAGEIPETRDSEAPRSNKPGALLPPKKN